MATLSRVWSQPSMCPAAVWGSRGSILPTIAWNLKISQPKISDSFPTHPDQQLRLSGHQHTLIINISAGEHGSWPFFSPSYSTLAPLICEFFIPPHPNLLKPWPNTHGFEDSVFQVAIEHLNLFHMGNTKLHGNLKAICMWKLGRGDENLIYRMWWAFGMG